MSDRYQSRCSKPQVDLSYFGSSDDYYLLSDASAHAATIDLGLEPQDDGIEDLMTTYMNVEMMIQNAVSSEALSGEATFKDEELPLVSQCADYKSTPENFSTLNGKIVETSALKRDLVGTWKLDALRGAWRPSYIRDTLVQARLRHRHEYNPYVPRYAFVSLSHTTEDFMIGLDHYFANTSNDMSVLPAREDAETGETRASSIESDLCLPCDNVVDPTDYLAAASSNGSPDTAQLAQT